jgi:glycosyltransferase involved in cell wall biosynthesis
MRVAIVTAQVPFVFGGAELLAKNLARAVTEAGHQVELVTLPFRWYPPSNVIDHAIASRLVDISESAGVTIDRAIGLKFPAWLAKHPHKVLWVIHQHRQAYDFWEQGIGDLREAPDGAEVRRFIQASDEMAFAEARAVYSISGNVAKRLAKYSGIEAVPLYSPPDNAELFRCADYEPFLFFPSRINSLKRQELVLQALKRTRQPVAVTFAGTADDPRYEQRLHTQTARLGLADRVRWAGQIDNNEKIDLYARCYGVIYPPLDEDYGYVTLEAMLAAKSILTCTDSGGTLEFIRHGENGLVAEPTPEALADAMDTLWARPDLAKLWGAAGREIYDRMGIGWMTIVETLLK